MRSWLAGFVVFGLAYAAIVTGIGIFTWPTLDSARYGTFENDLSGLHQALIQEVRIIESPPDLDAGSWYSIDRDTPAIHMINGHLIVLNPATSDDMAVAVAEAYGERVDHYLVEAQISQVETLLVVLLVPLVTFILFAWLARVLWNKLMQVR